MEPSTTAPPLRALLAEASELRRKGDLAAACYLETIVAIAMRASAADTRLEVRA